MSQQWYKKDTVQAALVTGGLAIIGVLITVFASNVTDGHAPTQQSHSQPGAPNQVRDTLSQPDSGEFNTGLSSDKIYSADGISGRLQLRKGLHLITAAESGLSSTNMPPGTYAFAHHKVLEYGNSEMLRVPEYGRLTFEIQKPLKGVLEVVAFVNADEYRKISVTNEVSDPATLYSDFWEDAKHEILVDPSSCHGTGRFVTLDDGSQIIAVDCEPKVNHRH